MEKLSTPAAVLADLRLAIDAGFDLVRPYGHVAPTSLYDHADRLGLLVWQDFPLVGSAANTGDQISSKDRRTTNKVCITETLPGKVL